jgi:hypothetical protein
MNVEVIAQFLGSLSFRQAVWFFPLAFTLHVLEEVAQFTNWAQRHAAPGFTLREYLALHLAGIAAAFGAALGLCFFPGRIVVFIFFTFIFTPGVFYNILFHTGATAYFGAYCPGLITALTIYPPLFVWLSRLAFSEGLLSNRLGWISFALAGVVHAADVSRNVFKAW